MRNFILCLSIGLILQIPVAASPVSVVFGSFSAANNENNIVLKWETLTETNSAHFEIQRNAHNDEVNFFTVASIQAAGASLSRQQYLFIDETAQEGVHYYRLKQVDNNSNFIYSTIIDIKYEPASLVKRFLNPVSNAVFAEFTAYDPNRPETNQWTIYDLHGRIICSEKITAKQVYAQLPYIAPGMYIWEFQVNDKRQRVRLLRQ